MSRPKRLKWLLILLALALLFAEFASAEDCFRNQFGDAMPVSPAKAQTTSGQGSAHGNGAWGLDGILYGFTDQCPISGPETHYRRPQASAGPLVVAWWEFYWTDPNARNNRCFVVPNGRKLPPAPPPQGPCAATSRCQTFTVGSGVFAPAIFPCSGSPTPGGHVPTKTKTSTSPAAKTATATRTRTAAPSGCCPPMTLCPKGVPPCVSLTSSRTPTRTPTGSASSRPTVTSTVPPVASPSVAVPTSAPSAPAPTRPSGGGGCSPAVLIAGVGCVAAGVLGRR